MRLQKLAQWPFCSLVLVAIVLLAALALFAAGARADSTALASVNNGACATQRNSGPTTATATTSCNYLTGTSPNFVTASGNAFATVDEIGGTAQVITNSNDPSGTSNFVNAFASWIVSGTITGTGSGTLTLSDSGISASTSGPDSSAFLSLEISNPTLGTLGFVCDNTSSASCGRFSSSLTARGAVTSGETIFLTFTMDCAAVGVGQCSMSDGLTLNLSPGLQFNSGIPGFLSGPPLPTPEPGTLLLLGTGLLGLAALAQRKARVFARAAQPS